MAGTTTAVLDGIVGGFVATVVMTAFMMALGDDSPPPTALFWSTYVGDGSPDDYVLQGMVLHMLYGIGAGLVFGAGTAALGLGVTGGLVTGLAGGVVYGLVLFVVAAAFWMNVVLRMDAEPKQAALFALFHLVYGVVLGAWLGVGVL
jgi:hypothetical protein